MLGAGYAGVAIATKADSEKFKKEHEQALDLGGGNSWTYESNGFQNGRWTGKQNDKDIVFSGGGNLTAKENIRLADSGNIGGFVFKAKEGQSETIYKVTSGSANGNSQANGGIFDFDGAGLDIEENVKVEWGLGFISGKATVNDALHKVGKGTLEIKTGANAE